MTPLTSHLFARTKAKDRATLSSTLTARDIDLFTSIAGVTARLSGRGRWRG
jgi:hypothetical protein